LSLLRKIEWRLAEKSSPFFQICFFSCSSKDFYGRGSFFCDFGKRHFLLQYFCCFFSISAISISKSVKKRLYFYQRSDNSGNVMYVHSTPFWQVSLSFNLNVNSFYFVHLSICLCVSLHSLSFYFVRHVCEGSLSLSPTLAACVFHCVQIGTLIFFRVEIFRQMSVLRFISADLERMTFGKIVSNGVARLSGACDVFVAALAQVLRICKTRVARLFLVQFTNTEKT
jgi:hypothetical protein